MKVGDLVKLSDEMIEYYWNLGHNLAAISSSSIFLVVDKNKVKSRKSLKKMTIIQTLGPSGSITSFYEKDLRIFYEV